MKVFYASIYLRIDLLRTDLIKKRAIKTFRRFGNKKDIRKKKNKLHWTCMNEGHGGDGVGEQLASRGQYLFGWFIMQQNSRAIQQAEMTSLPE